MFVSHLGPGTSLTTSPGSISPSYRFYVTMSREGGGEDRRLNISQYVGGAVCDLAAVAVVDPPAQNLLNTRAKSTTVFAAARLGGVAMKQAGAAYGQYHASILLYLGHDHCPRGAISQHTILKILFFVSSGFRKQGELENHPTLKYHSR